MAHNPLLRTKPEHGKTRFHCMSHNDYALSKQIFRRCIWGIYRRHRTFCISYAKIKNTMRHNPPIFYLIYYNIY